MSLRRVVYPILTRSGRKYEHTTTISPSALAYFSSGDPHGFPTQIQKPRRQPQEVRPTAYDVLYSPRTISSRTLKLDRTFEPYQATRIFRHCDSSSYVIAATITQKETRHTGAITKATQTIEPRPRRETLIYSQGIQCVNPIFRVPPSNSPGRGFGFEWFDGLPLAYTLRPLVCTAVLGIGGTAARRSVVRESDPSGYLICCPTVER